MSWDYDSRIQALRDLKQLQTAEKQRVTGGLDGDDLGIRLPPEGLRKVIKSISGSGVEITDVIMNNYTPESNHPSGAFFGPLYVGKNFGALMKAHPVCIDRESSLAGGYMVNFNSYKKLQWNPDIAYPDLKERMGKYGLNGGIGGAQHFCHDLTIALDLGFGGLLKKIRKFRDFYGDEKKDFYDGLEYIMLGLLDWIERTADEAGRMAAQEPHSDIRENLIKMEAINRKLLTRPPETFREACQLTMWYQIVLRMFNGSGSVGRLDQMLYRYYLADKASGILTDEEALFHIACYLLNVTDYVQLGGYDFEGRDCCNELSFLILEALHKMKIPSNIGVSVGMGLNEDLLRRGVEIMLEDRCGHPKFLGTDNVVNGFAKNGFPLWLARIRAYSGCHWFSLPGIDYSMSDIIKVNFVIVFNVAFEDMMADTSSEPSIEKLWGFFQRHLREAILLTAEGIDFHLEHMHNVYPELALDLCCHGPLERGLDASHPGGVDYYNIMMDGSGLATVADSFGAIEQVVCQDKRFDFHQLHAYLKADWRGEEAEIARLYMRRIKRFGYGGTPSDEYAARISRTYADECARITTPRYGARLIAGLFTWSAQIQMGIGVAATPNGRRAGETLSHGPNPDPGFREDGAATALAVAVANVQSGYGNCAPLQLDVEMGITGEENAVEIVCQLIKTHFELGGTQINLNIADRQKLLEAYDHPERHPDLVVRVTGFAAYFGSLSPDLRRFIIDRTL